MVFTLGILGILVTVCLHAVAITLLIHFLQRRERKRLLQPGTPRRAWVLAGAASYFAAKHAIDVLIWASAFWTFAGDELGSFENAYYFSAITYTTLGYGDIVLATRWRMLCGFEAMNGMLLFGLSTAFLFSLMQRLWAEMEQSS